MADICIPERTAGIGGIGGGQGQNGQASLSANGHGVSDYGYTVLKITTGMTAQYTIQLTSDLQGTIPAQLQGMTVKFICHAQGTHRNALFEVPVTYIGNGKVTLQLSPDNVDYRPGIHRAQIQCTDEQGRLRHVFPCWLQIQKSFQGSHLSCFRPITIAEVRMELYDTSGQQNSLLNDLQFSDIVIAQCILRAVKDWNQMPPALADNMTPANFPFTGNLASGAAAHCFKMASRRYYRNQMRHSNAGLSYDDSDKGQIYAAISVQMMQEWKAWIQAKKSQLNMLQCMGSVADYFMQGTNSWAW